MSRKKQEREIRAAHRRNKKDRQANGSGEFDDFVSLNVQLGTLGLALKQIPGDGNCLFRALGDQLGESTQDHMHHRSSVVEYMKQHRDDFEPFVEDDISWDSHLASLSENGTFGGNDSIVAFARLHSCTVVIHQLNKPLWQIHGGRNGSPGTHELHISYHNGDHYNSVRRIGDMGQEPRQRIRLGVALSNNDSILKQNEAVKRRDCDNYPCGDNSDDLDTDSGRESDYENCPGEKRMNKLANEVSRKAGVELNQDVFQALEINCYCVTAAVDYLLNEMSQKRMQSNLWSENGTGTRIIGKQEGHGVSRNQSSEDKLAAIQAKLQNKNLSNKRRKELKKSKNKIANDQRKKKVTNIDEDASELIVANIQSLTI